MIRYTLFYIFIFSSLHAAENNSLALSNKRYIDEISDIFFWQIDNDDTSNKSEIASRLLPLVLCSGNNTSTRIKKLLCLYANPYAINPDGPSFKEILFARKIKADRINLTHYKAWKKYYEPRERLFNRFRAKALKGTLQSIERNITTNTVIRITEPLPALPLDIIGLIFNYMGFPWTFNNHEDRIKKSEIKSNLNNLVSKIDSLSHEDRSEKINDLAKKKFPESHILGMSSLQWIYRKTNNSYLAKKCIDAGIQDTASLISPNLLFFITKSQSSHIDPELIKHFKDRNEFDVSDQGGNTPLHYATFYNNRHIIKTLIKAEANVNAQNNNGETPLHIAADSSNKSVVQYLIKKGATIDVLNSEMLTPLTIATSKQDMSIIDALISAGANVNGVNKLTPLIITK